MSTFSSSLTPLMFQLPYLLVYVIGIVVALVYISKHPVPATCVLLGCGLNLLLNLVTLAMQYSHSMGAAGMTFPIYAITNVLRAAGLAMVIAAAFVGRSSVVEDPFDRR